MACSLATSGTLALSWERQSTLLCRTQVEPPSRHLARCGVELIRELVRVSFPAGHRLVGVQRARRLLRRDRVHEIGHERARVVAGLLFGEVLRQFSLVAYGCGAVVLAGNVVRNTVLVGLEARGTPAIPLEVTISSSSMVICWAMESSMP